MCAINVLRRPSDLDLSYVERRIIDKQRTYYALLFEEKQLKRDTSRRFIKIFSRFWQKQVLNVIALLYTNHTICLEYSPFDDRFLLEHSLSNVTEWREVFAKKTDNFNGHEFRVAMYHERARAIFKQNFTPSDAKDMLGIDGIFTPIAMQKLNASIRLIEPTDGSFEGEQYPNGSIDGVLGLVLAGKAEASFNMRGIYPSLFKNNFESTYQKLRDDICIAVPRRGIASNFGNIFYPFDRYTWTLIVLMIPTFAGIYACVLHRYVKCDHPPIPIDDILFQVIAWNLSQTRSRLPKNTFSRVMLLIWIGYCFIITSSYHGNIMNSMLHRHRLPEINNIQELHDSGYHVLTVRRYIPFLRNYLDSFYSKETLAGRIHESTTDNHYIMIGAHDTRYAYANKEHILKHAMRNVSQREVFYIMQECPIIFQQAYLVRYGSVFKGRLNWIVRQFQDAGIFTMWQNYMRQQDPPPLETFKTNARVAFSLYNFQTTFYVLLFGYVMSTVVLLIELIVFKYRNTI